MYLSKTVAISFSLAVRAFLASSSTFNATSYAFESATSFSHLVNIVLNASNLPTNVVTACLLASKKAIPLNLSSVLLAN